MNPQVSTLVDQARTVLRECTNSGRIVDPDKIQARACTNAIGRALEIASQPTEWIAIGGVLADYLSPLHGRPHAPHHRTIALRHVTRLLLATEQASAAVGDAALACAARLLFENTSIARNTPSSDYELYAHALDIARARASDTPLYNDCYALACKRLLVFDARHGNRRLPVDTYARLVNPMLANPVRYTSRRDIVLALDAWQTRVRASAEGGDLCATLAAQNAIFAVVDAARRAGDKCTRPEDEHVAALYADVLRCTCAYALQWPLGRARLAEALPIYPTLRKCVGVFAHLLCCNRSAGYFVMMHFWDTMDTIPVWDDGWPLSYPIASAMDTVAHRAYANISAYRETAIDAPTGQGTLRNNAATTYAADGHDEVSDDEGSPPLIRFQPAGKRVQRT